MPLVDRYQGYLVYDTREANYQVLEGKETFEVFDETSGALSFRFTAYYNPRQLLTIKHKEQVIQRVVARALPLIRAKIAAGQLSDEMHHVIFTRKELLADASAPVLTPPAGDAAQPRMR
ncbi:MAG: hypothetical protein HY689_11040 [Chloroflexi bacterium]|nr:hypothetical protein [Chloroflexota bacterium]